MQRGFGVGAVWHGEAVFCAGGFFGQGEEGIPGEYGVPEFVESEYVVLAGVPGFKLVAGEGDTGRCDVDVPEFSTEVDFVEQTVFDGVELDQCGLGARVVWQLVPE